MFIKERAFPDREGGGENDRAEKEEEETMDPLERNVTKTEDRQQDK